jgi:hypothetical protein
MEFEVLKCYPKLGIDDERVFFPFFPLVYINDNGFRKWLKTLMFSRILIAAFQIC